MRYYSEDTVRDIIKGVAHTALEQSKNYADAMLQNHPSIEISEPHGRLIDADVIGNWLREQHVFSMPTTCKIDSIIKDAPTIIEASTESTEERE